MGEQIEIFCNQFAAELLVPSDTLDPRLNQRTYNDAAIEKAASYYKVSHPVILLKLVHQGSLTQRDYRRRIARWTEEYESRLERRAGAKNLSGGSYYNTHAVYLGYRFIELAFSKYHQGQCSMEELADHLKVKVKNLSGLEDCLLRKNPLEKIDCPNST